MKQVKDYEKIVKNTKKDIDSVIEWYYKKWWKRVYKHCLRCWVPITEIKREWSNWCSSRWHYYNKHLWK